MAYVYGLFYEDEKENEICFYVGKGTGYRDVCHLWESNLECESYENEYKARKIKKLKRNDHSPYARRLAKNLSDEKALQFETEIIEEVGLENLTNMKEGGSQPPTYTGKDNPFYGKSHTEEFKEKHSKRVKKMIKDGDLLTEEWRKKHSERMSGEENPMYGKSREFSEEWRSNMSKAQKKRYKDPREREKVSKMTKGKNNPMYGKTRSEEVKQKLHEAHKGENGHNSKLKKEEVKEIKWLINNSDILYEEIAKKYDISSSSISSISRGASWQHVTEEKNSK